MLAQLLQEVTEIGSSVWGIFLWQTAYLFFWNGHSYELYTWGVDGLYHILWFQQQITLKGSVATAM